MRSDRKGKVKSQKSFSIKATIILMFALVLIMSSITMGFLIFSRWFSSAEHTMEKITYTVNAQIYNQIHTFMKIPKQVNESNKKIIENGIIDLSDEDQRDKFFVGVLSSQDENIYSMSYGTADGEYYGARRDSGVIQIMRDNESTGGNAWFYSVGEDSTAGELSLALGDYDPRTRAWYKNAAEKGIATFSPLFKHFVEDDLAVSATWPVYSEEGTLHGVIGTHMLLSGIGSSLKATMDEYHGLGLIIEKETGYMVANSLDLSNFSILEDGTFKRNTVTDIKDSQMGAMYTRYLEQGEVNNFTVYDANERLYVNVYELQLEGIDWLIFSALPGKLLLTTIFESIQLTIILVILSILVAIILYYFITRKLFSPIDNLVKVARSIASGDLSKRIEVKRDDEIGNLSEKFNSVADDLQFLITNLETRVQERTENLNKVNLDLAESKTELQLLLDSTAEGIYGIDLDGNCTFCNLSALRLLGYMDQSELFGKNMHQLIHHSRIDGTLFPSDDCKIYLSITQGVRAAAEDEVFWRADGTPFAVAYHSYPQVKMGQLVGGVVTFTDITGRKRQEEEIEYLRCHDSLTGLHNRGCLEEHLSTIDIPKNYPLTVIFADLNGLKMTNDIFGHAAGDELIRKAAQILLRASRPGDTVARIGGDEFVILLPKTDEEQSEHIMANIRTGFSKARVEAMKCSISLGSATKREDLVKIDEIFANAENEMYKDKTKNRKSVNQNIITNIQESYHSNSPREREHSKFVRDMSRELGKEMKLSETDISKLERAAYLHDIGKITLDKKLLLKDTYTDLELELVKQHPVVGFRILELFDDTLDLADSVYSHHEMWDGNGYPRGLHGEQIPLLARILSVVELYERIYNRGDSSITDRKGEALQAIREGSGTQFDPDIVKVFIHFIEKNNND